MASVRAKYELNLEELAKSFGSSPWQPFFVQYIKSHPADFFVKNVLYTVGEESFSLSNNLVRKNQYAYYVVSNQLHDSSELTAIRLIVAEVIFPPDGGYTFVATSDRVLRITHRSSFRGAFFTGEELKVYANLAYSKWKLFQNMFVEAPIYRECLRTAENVKKYKRASPHYMKFMFVMKRVPGMNLSSAINSNRFKNLTFKQVISVIKSLLVAYKTQVSMPGYVHNDIKPANIMVEVMWQSGDLKVDFHFIDLETAEKKGAISKYVGTSCYVPLERLRHCLSVLYPNEREIFFYRNAVKPGVDIFALGMVILEIINPEFAPHNLLGISLGQGYDEMDQNLEWHRMLQGMGGRFDPFRFSQDTFFRYISDIDAISFGSKDDLSALIKGMTAQLDSQRMCDIDQLISYVDLIDRRAVSNIKPKLESAATSTPARRL